jgi:hypothetical protein
LASQARKLRAENAERDEERCRQLLDARKALAAAKAETGKKVTELEAKHYNACRSYAWKMQP